ncbi:M14 family metallopeptidase [Candidatus Venteria ishoeyi]|uniref:M14 family metallopeptidase n=1 Tax=Candidatus Venteria ishoeyi TaxID=1899563 RepID=UPI0025A639D7|nr:M14 family metallopeptidase [Candidatus Venteria ishoeyi]MDM8546704.1 M14 family metallopeptidase [Candidatus Venteria ishoeyi]
MMIFLFNGRIKMIKNKHYCLLVFLLFGIPLLAIAAPSDLPIKHWLQVQINNPQQWQQLSQLVDDVRRQPSGLVDIYADTTTQQALLNAGFDVQLKIQNLSHYYQQRASSAQRRSNMPLGVGSMAGFRTIEELDAEISRLAASYPHLIHAFIAGYSHEGRPLWVLRLSDNPQQYEAEEPTVWMDGLHHAREVITGEILLQLADYLATAYAQDSQIQDLLNNRNLLLMPCVNPDGYAYNQQIAPQGGGLWRKNRSANADGSFGVDLNRNYATAWGDAWAGSSGNPQSTQYRGEMAFSEPETAALAQLWSQQHPQLALSLHSYGEYWMFPWGFQPAPIVDEIWFREQAALMTQDNHYRVDSAWNLFGSSNGATDDYLYDTYGTLVYTVEVGTQADGFWPEPERILPLFQQLLPGLLTALEIPLYVPPILSVQGSSIAAEALNIQVNTHANTPVTVYCALQAENHLSIPGILGQVYLSLPAHPLLQGMSDENGQISWLLNMPEPLPSGISGVALQAFVETASPRLSCTQWLQLGEAALKLTTRAYCP